MCAENKYINTHKFLAYAINQQQLSRVYLLGLSLHGFESGKQ